MERRSPLLEKSSSRLEILDRDFIDAACNGNLCEDERLVHAASQPDATESPVSGNESNKREDHKSIRF